MILNGIWMLLMHNSHFLCQGQERREKKGVSLGQVKIPEKAWLLVVFIMNSYRASFFSLLACAAEAINCLSLRFWLNPRVNIRLSEINYYIYVSICENLIPHPVLQLKQGWRPKYFFAVCFISVPWWNFISWPKRIRPVNLKKTTLDFFSMGQFFKGNEDYH